MPHGEAAVAEVEKPATGRVSRGARCDGGSRAAAPVAQHAVEEAAAGEVVDGAGAHAWRVDLDVQPPCNAWKACTHGVVRGAAPATTKRVDSMDAGSTRARVQAFPAQAKGASSSAPGT